MSENVLTTQTPGSTGANDGQILELGLKFQSASGGVISAIRYWRDALDTQDNLGIGLGWPVVGNIWSAGGTLLRSQTFSDLPANIFTPGWFEETLTSPLTIQAATDYIVSVNSIYYVLTAHGFDSNIVSGNLTGEMGLFHAGKGSFPDTAFNNGNYFRDVRFDATISLPHVTRYIISPVGESGALVGAAAATFSASNAPAAMSIRRWVTQSINGVLGYIPWFASTSPTLLQAGWGELGAGGAPIGVAVATFTTNNAPVDVTARRWITVSVNGVDGWLPWFSNAEPGTGRGWSRLGESGAPVGSGTATMSASNAPTAISPKRWLSLSINGFEGFLPWFST
jgi:hypothetical protein